MLPMASSKFPLYGSCFEQSPLCHVCNMTSMFSGSGTTISVLPRLLQDAVIRTFGASPGLPKTRHKGLEIFEAEMLLMESFPIEGLAEAPAEADVQYGLSPKLTAQ